MFNKIKIIIAIVICSVILFFGINQLNVDTKDNILLDGCKKEVQHRIDSIKDEYSYQYGRVVEIEDIEIEDENDITEDIPIDSSKAHLTPSNKKSQNSASTNSLEENKTTISALEENKTTINGRNYNWYVSQYGTGVYSDTNCGVAVGSMVAKWLNPNFNITVEQLRENRYGLDIGWSTDDMYDFLSEYNIYHTVHYYAEAETLIEALDRGSIIIVLVDPYYIGSSSAMGGGHYMVVYGYEKENNEISYLTHDPASGQSIKYSHADMHNGMRNRWEYVIEIN